MNDHHSQREAYARVIDPISWEAFDTMSPEDFKFSGFDTAPSLSQADTIAREGEA